jgi:hypothetical protein
MDPGRSEQQIPRQDQGIEDPLYGARRTAGTDSEKAGREKEIAQKAIATAGLQLESRVARGGEPRNAAIARLPACSPSL